MSSRNFVKIANLMLSEYVPTLEEKHISFTYDDKACEYLASPQRHERLECRYRELATGGRTGRGARRFLFGRSPLISDMYH